MSRDTLADVKPAHHSRSRMFQHVAMHQPFARVVCHKANLHPLLGVDEKGVAGLSSFELIRIC